MHVSAPSNAAQDCRCKTYAERLLAPSALGQDREGVRARVGVSGGDRPVNLLDGRALLRASCRRSQRWRAERGEYLLLRDLERECGCDCGSAGLPCPWALLWVWVWLWCPGLCRLMVRW